MNGGTIEMIPPKSIEKQGGGASRFIETDNRGGDRNSEEFSDTIGGFESKGDERPTEKGFGSFGRISQEHEEATVPLDDDEERRAAFEREVDTAECATGCRHMQSGHG
ncbi:hypothetical protein HPB50_005809 [Hyalomma asiaticum]|uniref:Uncharacterized protein n=1 Tax=Hyalomma asiaticum TaxID=266040 RepID=A0ACB7TFP8_HYAAI|nr:hypothetical protein HPB50_005809 [Hyalomma asiaticum]